MNAAERFFAASRDRDIVAASEALAQDVVMLNPATDEETVGREAVTAALSAVERSCDEFRHTHLLANATGDGTLLCGLVFEARIDDSTLQGVDLVEIDKMLDQINTFTVLARPLSALMALGASHVGQGQGGVSTAA